VQPKNFSPKVGSSSGVYAALSKDDGANWKIKPLPMGLPHETDLKNFSTLGYSTVRQGPNGVIHILSTMTHPCLHYEINEAWIESSADSDNTDSHSAPREQQKQKQQARASTASGGTATWGYIVDLVYGYALHGTFTTTHPNSSALEYNATYNAGMRLSESYHNTKGRLVWRWTHQPASNSSRSMLERFDDAGQLRVRSEFDNNAVPRDWHLIQSNPVGHRLKGLTAHGSACLWAKDGSVVATSFNQGMVNPGAAASCSRD